MAEIKILHVDDNPRIIQVTQLYFKHFGSNFKLTPAFSTAQGLELLERESFDVIIADYKMPEMNGILADTGEHRAMREKDLMERICRRSCIPLSLQNLRFHLNSLEREGVIASVRQPSSGERFFFIKPAEAVEKKDKGIFLTKIYDREKRIQELEELIWSSRP